MQDQRRKWINKFLEIHQFSNLPNSLNEFYQNKGDLTKIEEKPKEGKGKDSKKQAKKDEGKAKSTKKNEV